jgi:hypothetical protein
VLTQEEMGSIFETYLLHEIRAFLSYTERRYPLFFFRTFDGVEIDLLFESSRGMVALEFKASRTWRGEFKRGSGGSNRSSTRSAASACTPATGNSSTIESSCTPTASSSRRCGRRSCLSDHAGLLGAAWLHGTSRQYTPLPTQPTESMPNAAALAFAACPANPGPLLLTQSPQLLPIDGDISIGDLAPE